MMLWLARTTMSPLPCWRRPFTVVAGSVLTMRELPHELAVRVDEKTTFSTLSSHWAKARSRDSAFSSLATVGQYPPNPS